MRPRAIEFAGFAVLASCVAVTMGACRGTESNTLDVHYLQTPSIFADVRFPRDRGDFSHARSFDDLSDEELSQLARQRGFTGHTTVDGLISTWHHELDFQPPDSSADIGRIARNGADAMFEYALDSSYTESWRSTSAGANTFLVVRMHSTLPWREKQRLDFVDGVMVAAESATLLVPRAPIAYGTRGAFNPPLLR